MMNFIKKLLGDKPEFQNKSAINLFKDNAYLTDQAEPEAALVLGLQGNVIEMGALKEDNALLLKTMASRYNVKIIGCTFHDMPAKSELAEFHKMMVAAGVAEVYYPHAPDKILLITPSGVEEKNTAPLNGSKYNVYDQVCHQFDLNKEQVFVLDKSIREAEMIFSDNDDFGHPLPRNISEAVLGMQKIASPKMKR